jgi:NAD-dependent deacetylase
MAERGVNSEREWRRARELFAAARRITALTGAGLSTAAGIPDFRGPNGVWTRDPEAQRQSDIRSYLADPDVRRQSWQSRASHPAWAATPTAGHRAFARLAERGLLRAVLTQNIDELHQRGELDPGDVLELHGSMFGTVCLNCGARGTMREAIARVAAGEDDPPCRDCGGILKSGTVSFGQALDEEVVRQSHRAAQDCDLFLAAGTSLTVYPAAGFVDVALAAGADLIICNAEPTPYDEQATAVLRGPLDEVLPELVSVSGSQSI